MEELPKIPNLHLRKGKYYFRTRVPKDIVDVLGKKEIKIALGTDSYSEAKSALPNKQIKVNEIFAVARKKLQKNSVAPVFAAISHIDIERRIILWHQNEITKHTDEYESIDLNSSEEEAIQIIDNLQGDLSIFYGGDESQYASGIQKTVKYLIPELDTKKQQSEYNFAQSLVRKSIIEQTYKQLEILGDTYSRVPFQLATTNIEQASFFHNNLPQHTWGELITKFKTAKKSDGVTEAALKKYKIPFDFSLELFGKSKLLSSITTEDCREFRDKLLKLPSNARKRFPKLSLLDCINANSAHGKSTLSITSINDNLGYLTAVLNFAVREGYLEKNPSQYIPNLKQKKNKEDSRRPFSESSLQRLFQAPIFTGCIDDEWNYKSIGINKPRRHKFWIPLIALHTGMRLNEICQLFASDITCIDGINVIRSIINDESEKTLKTDSSERDVPIHNQLIQIGFLDYVKQIKSQGHKRLFPDMTPDSKGKYSSNFSKWFARFLKSNNIKSEGICFHSFRHNFRDAIRESYMNKDLGAALGGWKASKETMDQYGAGYQLKSLNNAMQQMEFNVELKHLITSKKA